MQLTAMSTEEALPITIDSESGHDPAGVRSRPLSFYSTIEGIPERLQPIFESAGAIPTPFFTVEIMENDDCIGVLRAIGDWHELGTHSHPAFIEPDKKHHDYAGLYSLDSQCHCTPEVKFKKLENLKNIFIQRFHKRPLSFCADHTGFNHGSQTSQA